MASSSEIGRNWRIAFGAFVGIGGGFASLYFYTAGLFIKPLAAEFGWTRGEASLGSLSTVVGVIAFPLAGRLIDRVGETRVALASGLALAGSFCLLGILTNGLFTYLALIVFLTIVSAGSLSIGYNRIIVRHFSAQRGLALGLALTGTAVGSALVAPLLAVFIGSHGWRNGYFVLAACATLMTIAATMLLAKYGETRQLNSGPQRQADDWRTVVRHPSFLPTSAMIFLSATAVLGSTMHIVPLLTDSGLSLVRAGAVASALGISVIAGRILTGYLLDHWDAGWVTWILLTFSSLGALCLWSGHDNLIVPGVVLIGFGVGTEGDLLAFLLGRRFPAHRFGSVYGTIFGVHALGGALGGIIAGASFDATGSYAVWLLGASVALALAGLIALATERNFVPQAE
jgi:predicted MFS family arabinose efflux permease